MDKNLRPYFAEFLGTFAFVFLSAGAVCVSKLAAITGQMYLSLLGIALVAGLAYAVAVTVTLPISGGYLNPAVPLTLWVFKRIDGTRAAWLMGVQLLGAVVAGMFLRGLLSFQELALVEAQLGTPHLNAEVFGIVTGRPDLKLLLIGIGTEVTLTFILVFAIFGLALDPRATRLANGWTRRLLGFWLGLVVVADTLVGFNLTGAALNPARWFGTAVWEFTLVPLYTQGPFRDHSVYWIGPLVGALIAGTLYTSLVLPPTEEETTAHHLPATGPSTAVKSTLFRARK